MNKTNPAIISLNLNCPLYNNIINMDIIKLNNIERKLDLNLRKKKWPLSII